MILANSRRARPAATAAAGFRPCLLGAGLLGAGLLGLILAATAMPPARAQDAPPEAPAATAAEGAAQAPAEAPAPQETPAAAPLESGAGPAPTPGTGGTSGAEPQAPEATAAEPPAAEPTPAGPGDKGPLVVVSWGGAYSKSQDEAILRPFTRATGIAIESKVYAGDLDLIRAQVERGEVVWDVVDVDPVDAELGCTEGLFEKLSFVLPAAPDGTAAAEDFLPGTVQLCAVGSVAWSMVIAHETAPEGSPAAAVQPKSLQDFFDLQAFPGQRGLRRTPMANLEWALLADGAAPEEVYDLLSSEEGIERAFAKLDTIRPEIVWWEDAKEPSRLLARGQVVMTSTYNAPIFNDIALRQRPFGLIWDGQIWDIDLWAVPKAAPHREAALEFIRFATSTESLARQTRWIPYGPLRRSSAGLTGNSVLSDLEVAPYLPTSADNLESALRNDALFWREQGPALVERFNSWLER
jgi:putative spermidine/putrescine transport system substrate-binding protein